VFDIVGKRRWFFLFSLLITIPGLVFILLTPITNGQAGLKFSIDYTGGTEWSIRFADANVSAEEVRAELEALGQEDATVTRTGRGFLDIRMSRLDLRELEPTPGPSASPGASAGPAASGATAAPGASASPAPTAAPTATPTAAPSGSPEPSSTPIPGSANTVPTQGEIGAIATALQERFGPIAEQAKLSSIGATVSADLVQQAIILILVGALGILVWITIRFRDVKFGVTALVALLHDVIVVVGFFAIFGTLWSVKIDGLFVTAMLTVIGFSVHDTIVVFDRIRENRVRHAGETFGAIVNHSILQTIARSIITSLTVVVTLGALLLLGPPTIRTFTLALLLGVVSGTYSSIFNASQILVAWDDWDRRRKTRAAAPRPARSGAR
jgi:preprotein translocase subunit SecF